MVSNIKLLKIYYLLTPVFLAVELMFNFSIRITIPGESVAFKYAYYAICFTCAFFVFRNPVTASFFSLAECVFNLFLLMLSVMYPITHVAPTLNNNYLTGYQFAASDLVHFIMVGGILLYAFYSNPIIRKSRKIRF